MYSYRMRSGQSDTWSNNKKNDTKNNHSSSSITQGTGSSSSSYYDRTKTNYPISPFILELRHRTWKMKYKIEEKEKDNAYTI